MKVYAPMPSDTENELRMDDRVGLGLLTTNALTFETNPLDEQFFINLEKVNAFYTESFDKWTTCKTDVGCVATKTSLNEHAALLNLYTNTIGTNWVNNDNWTEGDPCLNHWFGI